MRKNMDSDYGILCDWHSLVAFHAGGVQATCTINSADDLQNLLCTMMVLRAVFKTKPSPPNCLLCIQPMSQSITLTLCLHRCRPRSQSCALSTYCPSCSLAAGGERARRGRRLWGWGTRSRRGCWHCSGRRLSAQGSRSGSTRRSLESTRCLTAAFWPWGGDGRASAQSELTRGDCASLQRRGRRVVWQIHEVQQILGSKEHCTVAKALSTVWHCWLRSWSPTFGMFRSLSEKSKLRKKGRISWLTKQPSSLELATVWRFS